MNEYDRDFVYDSGDETEPWDMQTEEFWQGDDESDLDESESEEEEDNSLDAHIDAFFREKEGHFHDGSEYVLGDVEEYIYEPLQHLEGRTAIRLIHLHPSATFGAPLVCTLSTTSIGHDGGDLPCNYAALSYTWGPASFSELLFVLPTPKPKRAISLILAITRNLHDALVHLRHKDIELIIWVDAVCINQSDTEEKDRQLGVMSKIYSYALTTHAWMGLDTADRDGERCLGWIEAIVKSATESYTQDGLSSNKFGWNNVISRIIPNREDGPLLLKKFFGREYFKRRWTIQERYYAGVGIGFHVHCGKSSALWRPYEHGQALHRLQEWMAEQCVYDQQTIAQVRSAIPLAKNYSPDGTDGRDTIAVLSFMERYAEAQCSDPRDKVLSLLDVITVEYHFPLLPAKVGYGTSVNRVYLAFARALYFNAVSPRSATLSSRKHVDTIESRLDIQEIHIGILTAAGSMQQSERDIDDIDIPSWVPDWRQKPTHDTSFPCQTYKLETTRGCSQPFIFGQDGVHGLCSGGIFFDEVEQAFMDGFSTLSIEKQISFTTSMCSRTGLLSNTYQKGHAKEGLNQDEDQLRNLFMSWRWCFDNIAVPDVCDLAGLSLSDGRVAVMNAVANAFALSSHRIYIESTSPGMFAPRLSRQEYTATKEKAMKGRKLYITKRGFIGAGPESTVAGDQIWMLTQSNSPFLLRPLESSIACPELGRSENKEERRQLEFAGCAHRANLVGAAHLFPPSPQDITTLIDGLEISELCII